MEKKKVLVSGCNGHMGQIVCRLIDESPNFEVLYGFDTVAREFSPFPVFENTDDLAETDIIPDVIIDFSVPSATMDILGYADLYDISIVIATTGFTDSQLGIISTTAADIPIFMSANMSLGVNVMNDIIQRLATALPCSGIDANNVTDIEIVETHHNRKKDAPSGTAKLFANSIKSALGNTRKIVYDRTGKREKNEIGISSVRGGNIVGTHTVYFFGPYETIEVTHTAHSRDVFAEGALEAAKFLIGKAPGMYSMDNLM